MKYNRARYEDELLSRFKEVLPAGMEVILLVDRNFTNPKFFRFLEEELKFQYIIRIKSSTTIIHGEKELKAREWLHPNGRIVGLKNPCITLQAYKISQFVAIKDKGMKSQWFLASNTTITPREIVTLYAKRWKIEPHFLDLKDNRYEWDWEWGQTHVKSCERRDKLMLLLALSYTLLIILGDAGEQIGFDEKLKVNTVKTRTHSLFRQGEFYYEFFFRFSQEEQDLLMEKFSDLLRKQDFWIDVLGDLK